MSPPRTSRVAPTRYRIYLGRAEAFARMMDVAAGHGEVDVAVSNAAHCVISACDALLVHQLGVRSKGEDHEEVIDLLASLGIEGTTEHRRQVASLLEAKRQAEYEDRSMTVAEGREALEQARRILEWARSHLPR